MLKEAARQKYEDFKKEESRPFSGRGALMLVSVGNTFAGSSLLILGGIEALKHVYISPEGLIPTAVITGAAALCSIRSIIQERALDNIAIEIAREEERVPSKIKSKEKLRTRAVIWGARRLSPSQMRWSNPSVNMVGIIDKAHSTAKTVNREKPTKIDTQTSNRALGDYIHKEHTTEVERIISTSAELVMPEWQKYLEESAKTIIKSNEALNMIASMCSDPLHIMSTGVVKSQ